MDWLRARCMIVLLSVLVPCQVLLADNDSAAEQQQRFELNIPAQPLSAALNALSVATRSQILATSSVLEGQTSRAVNGRLTVIQALQSMLADSGLTVTKTGKNSYTIAFPKQTDLWQPMEEVRVTGTRREGYIIKHSDALGVALEIQKMPASLTVISDDLLEDIGARDLASVLIYSPGIANADTGGQNRENFNIRGFEQTETYINGVRQSISSVGIRAIETVERVEILKGPSGVEASMTSPGGFINIITKKPQDEFAAELFVGGGDYNFFRIGGDITGPIIEGVLSGRLIAAYQQKQFWRDGQDDRPVTTIAPSIKWSIHSSTELLVEYEYSKQDDPLDRGVVYIEGAGLKDNFLPRTFSVHGDNDKNEAETHRVDIALTHRFNDALSAQVYYQYTEQSTHELAFRDSDFDCCSLYLDDGITFSGNPIIDLYFSDFGVELESETVQADVTADFYVGSVRHMFNGGWSTSDNESIDVDENRDFIYGEYAHTLDIFNPDNRQSPNQVGSFVDPENVEGDTIDSLFGQWAVEWTEQLRTVISVRYDDVEFFERQQINGIGPLALALLEADFAPDPIELESRKVSDDILSYRFGFSYDISQNLTAFAGYSVTGEPQIGFTRSGSSLDPVESSSYEAGLKFTLFDGKAMSTLTAYFLEREEIAIADPSNTPDDDFLLPLGSAEIMGIEFEVVGKVSTDISIFGGISYQESEITQSDEPVIGNTFANIPRIQASAFVNYNASAIGLSGLDISLGVVHQGDREANSGNQYELPAYTRVDVAAGYTFANDLEIRLNVENIFDETYYTSAQDSIFGSDQVAVGDRRLYQITATKRF